MIRSRTLILMLAGCFLVAAAGPASAVTVKFREGGGTDDVNGGSYYIGLDWDGTDINPATNDLGHYDGQPDSYYLRCSVADPSTETWYGIAAIKDLLTELPIASGDINSATLTVCKYWGDGDTMMCYRITSDWMLDVAGSNEDDVTGSYRQLSTTTTWASGAFSTSDYDSANGQSMTWEWSYREKKTFNVTDMVKAMYTGGKMLGFALTNYDTGDASLFTYSPHASEISTRMELEIDYTKAGSFALTVTSGTGTGSYAAGVEQQIVADAIPSGMLFAGWTGDIIWVYDPMETDTLMQMPPSAAAVTATYGAAITLTVNAGTGSGQYLEGDVIDIDADPAAAGFEFLEWTGDTTTVADTAADVTTITIPATDVEVTATYTTSETTYTLTVNDGTGSGDHLENTVVNITAATPPAGMWFDQWFGDISRVADIDSSATTFTMGNWAAEITALFSQGTRVKFREYNGTNVEAGFTDVVFDDAFFRGPSTASDDNYAESQLMFRRDPEMGTVQPGRVSVVGIKDLFTQLPRTSGADAIKIYKAALWLYWTLGDEGTDPPGSGSGGYGDDAQVNVAPMLTDWLSDTAGTNEYEVSGLHSKLSTSVEWANGGITEADWDMVNVSLHTARGHRAPSAFPDPPYVFQSDPVFDPHNREQIDVTTAMKALYTSGNNYGLIMYASDPDYCWTKYYSSESALLGPGLRPAVVIDYAYIAAFTLTVNSGTGTGPYIESEVVPVAAGPPPAGQEFDAWTGDTTYVADVNAASTTVTMPAGNVEITATYTDLPAYTLTVTSGTGGDDYPATSIVAIEANAAAAGWIFDVWTGDVTYVAEVTDSSTTVTMPAQAVSVTATYRELEDWILTVNSGTDATGQSDHDAGVIVPIAADKPAIAKVFDQWTGSVTGIDDVYSMNTTITMPAGDTEITATYTDDVVDGFRISLREGGGGSYTDTLFDDTYIVLDAGSGDADTSTHGTESDIEIIDETGDNSVSLICAKELFTLVPQTSNATAVTINSAYLIVRRYQGPLMTPFDVARLTTNWVPDEAGSNEEDVSGIYSENSSSTTWANFLADFSVADYDTSALMRMYIQDGGYNAEQMYDITPLVQDMYSNSTNYGLALMAVAGFVSPDPEYYGIRFRSSEKTEDYLRPVLRIDYQYGVDYTLTVNSGDGDGSYPEGAVQGIVADAPASGKEFDAWTGDTGAVADTGASTTSVTMPAANVEVTATYTDIAYTLTVDSGSGDGPYTAGTEVPIVAEAAPSGQVFDAWIGDTATVADTGAASTTITMPAANATVTATYTDDVPALDGDRNGDGWVGQPDLDIVLDQWGRSGAEVTDSRADANGDGWVGQPDLDIVLDDWGKSS